MSSGRAAFKLAMAAMGMWAATGVARGDERPVPAPEEVRAPAPVTAPVAPPVPPPPYAAPWMMRSLVAGNSVRLDDTMAFYDDGKGNSGISNVTFISGGYRPWRNLQLLVKLGMVGNQPPTGAGGYSFLNGVIGALYDFKLPQGFHLTPTFCMSLPWGMGGGDNPDAAVVAANKAGGLNRQALEGMIFGVNFYTLNAGLSAGWVRYGVTVQADALLFQSFRVRASSTTEPDAYRTNFTSGLHVGYYFIPQLSIGSEIHYQRYLSDVAAVKKDATAEDALTGTIGLRGHFKTGRAVIKPGVSYTRAFIGQEVAKDYNVVQIDLAVAFR